MCKIPYINTENGICLSVNGKFVPVKEIAERYGFEIEDEDDIWIFIDAINSAAIESAMVM